MVRVTPKTIVCPEVRFKQGTIDTILAIYFETFHKIFTNKKQITGLVVDRNAV